MKCEPRECYQLNERIAIMAYCGEVQRNLKSKAVRDTCAECDDRPRLLSAVLEKIK